MQMGTGTSFLTECRSQSPFCGASPHFAEAVPVLANPHFDVGSIPRMDRFEYKYYGLTG